MKTFLLSLLALLTLGRTIQNPMSTSQPYLAQLETEEQGSMLTIKSRFTNNSETDVSFSYRMKSERSGTAGKSVSSQSGSVRAFSGQTITLSKTSFNIAPQDSYTIELEIFDQSKVVAKDHIVFRGN